MKRWRVGILVVMCGVLGVLVRGYRYGVDNQIEQIPQILRYLDPGYLRNDLMVNVHDKTANPRYFFVRLMGTLAWVSGLEYAYFGMTMLSNIAIAVVTARTIARWTRANRWGVLMGTALVLGLESIQLGAATSIGGEILTPALVATPLALYGLGQIIDGNMIVGGLSSAVASLLHPAVGLATFGLAVSNRLVVEPRMVRIPRGWLVVGMLVGVASYWVVVGGRATIPLAEFYRIYVTGRNWHHVLPSAWKLKDYVEAGAMVLVCWWLRGLFKHKVQVGLVIAGVIGACVVGYVGVEMWPNRAIVVLQLFRMMYLLKWVGLMALGVEIGRVMQSEGKGVAACLVVAAFNPIAAAIAVGGKWLGEWRWAAALIYVLHVTTADPRPDLIVFGMWTLVLAVGKWRQLFLVVIAGLVFDVYQVKERFAPQVYLGQLTGETVKAAGIIAANTPADALIVAPPSWGQIRFLANRALVADIKTDPFEDADLVQWNERMTFTYGEHLDERMFGVYEQIDQHKLETIAAKYGANYAVVDKQVRAKYCVVTKWDKYQLLDLGCKGK